MEKEIKKRKRECPISVIKDVTPFHQKKNLLRRKVCTYDPKIRGQRERNLILDSSQHRRTSFFKVVPLGDDTLLQRSYNSWKQSWKPFFVTSRKASCDDAFTSDDTKWCPSKCYFTEGNRERMIVFSVKTAVKQQEAILRHPEHFQSDLNLGKLVERRDGEYHRCLNSS
ncbi:hypothetical protein TNCV_4163401 [Trichonephila clavipes]|nr:hypothetical protein TNCV_4163401 [Trichonephila clavipes]